MWQVYVAFNEKYGQKVANVNGIELQKIKSKF